MLKQSAKIMEGRGPGFLVIARPGQVRTSVKFLLISLSILLLIQARQTWALEIDQRLPLRILKISESKKTVLINRGVEDGLVVGDHAKFFLTTGVVARGVVIKTSPSRSVWSLYRLASAKDIEVDKVMNLKISTPVKLTKDITKMFAEDEAGPATPPEGIVLAEGAEDIDKSLSAEENKDLHRMTSDAPAGGNEMYISQRTLEFWGMLHLNSMTSVNSTGANGQGTSGSATGVDLLGGMEKYFLDYESWYGKFSLFPFFHYAKQEYSSIEGHTISSSLFAFGAGFNWHFLAPPLSIERIILFVGPTFGLGSATDSAALQRSTTSLPNLTGKVNFFSVGGGVKYFTSSGIGLRAILDYYRRVESYVVEGSADSYTKEVSGPRILLGLSYRF